MSTLLKATSPDSFSFAAAAEVYTGQPRVNKGLDYRRFSALSSAVAFVVEELPLKQLGGTAIETLEQRFEGAEIRTLYNRPDYPLPRSGPHL